MGEAESVGRGEIVSVAMHVFFLPDLFLRLSCAVIQLGRVRAPWTHINLLDDFYSASQVFGTVAYLVEGHFPAWGSMPEEGYPWHGAVWERELVAAMDRWRRDPANRGIVFRGLGAAVIPGTMLLRDGEGSSGGGGI